MRGVAPPCALASYVGSVSITVTLWALRWPAPVQAKVNVKIWVRVIKPAGQGEENCDKETTGPPKKWTLNMIL